MSRLFAAVLLASTLVAAFGCSPSAEPASPPSPEASEYVYVGMAGNDAPFVDYEGAGMVVSNLTVRRHEGDPYRLELVATDHDPTQETYVVGDDVTDRIVVRLMAEVVRTGEDGFGIRGSLEARQPTRIQFVQMTQNADPSGETFPELAFAAGRHDFAFDAAIVGWLDE